MAVSAVVFNGTRLNDSDSNTGWGNYNASGGSPASEFPLAYQVTSGTTTGAVNKKVSSSSQRQGVDYNGSSVDYTAAANRLLFLKVIVSDSFDLNSTWGLELGIGSADTSNFHQYNIAGSGSNLSVYNKYPSQGGYLITAIDPTIDTWAEVADSGGATDQTAITWYAIGAQFVNGTAKSENVAFDSIDYGTGLTITAGDGVSTEGNFIDFVIIDQDDKTKRWGVVTGSGDIVKSHGILTIGTASVTEFLDTSSIVLFPDGYHSAGLVGIKVGMSNASSIIKINSLIIGEGTRNGVVANDTRPDFIVTGTSGTFDSEATLRNFRNITYTSICDIINADLECELLTQALCNISDTTIRTNSLASISCLQDPTFGTTTDLHDCTFIQTGVGHAIELSGTDTTYTFTNLFFSGYGTTSSTSSAIEISATTGTTTIAVSGGDSPTYTTAGATVVITNAVNVGCSGVTEGTSIKIIANETVGTITKGDVIFSGFADNTGEAKTTSFNYEGAFDPSGLDVMVRARNSGIAVASIAEDNGTGFTDETTEGNSSSTGDMILLPTVPASNDAYYFGSYEKFSKLKLNISTVLTQSSPPTFVWEYWNGAWVSLSGVVDGTNGLETLDGNIVSWTLPTDWSTTTINTQGPLYYIRFRLSVVGTITQIPIGTKVTLDTTKYLPYTANRTIISGTGLADIASWIEDTIAKLT